VLTEKQAYCGECAHISFRPANKKGKGKAPATDFSGLAPFRKCIVEDCGKPAVKTSWIKVYE